MIDIGKLKTQLKEFDALRNEAEIKTASVEHIQPQYTDEWPARPDSSVRNALVNAGRPMLHWQQADAISTWRCRS